MSRISARNIEIWKAVPIDAIIFDLDDTLVWQSGKWRRSLRGVLRDLGLDLPMKVIQRYNGGNICSQIIEEFGLGVSDAWLNTEVDRYHSLRTGEEVKLVPGALRVLRSFQGKVDYAVVTSSPTDKAVQRIASSRLSGFIPEECIIGRDSVANLKPHPEPIEEASRRLKVEPYLTVVVGNEPTDIEAANAAGARSVLVAHGEYSGKRKTGATIFLPSLNRLTPMTLSKIGKIA